MKNKSLIFSLIIPVTMLASCAVTTAPPTASPYTDNTGYKGYTVDYGYDNGSDVAGTYRGYGGWASTYYAPGFRDTRRNQ